MLQQLRPGDCAVLFRAFDNLYDSSTISGVLNIDLNTPDIFPLNLSLDLPVSAVIQWTNDFCRKEQNSFDNILVRDAFEYVLARNCLRPMVLPTDCPNIIFSRYRVQKLLRWITSSEVCLWSFFACLCLPVTPSGPIRLDGDRFLDPLFKTLIGPDIDPILKLISPKRFRQARLIELLQKIPLSSPV